MKGSDTMVSEGKQYHLGIGKGDITNKILLAGDLKRIRILEEYLESIRTRVKNREFYTVTGKYNGEEISAIATGIGPDNTEIALIEIARALDEKECTVIRIGSCGSLQDYVKLGDLVISTAAVRLENTSSYYVPEGFPAVASWEIIIKLKAACEKLGYRYHVGLTATAPSFYAAQQRDLSDLNIYPRFNTLDELSKLKVLNFEMESSVLFILSHLLGFKAGSICVVLAERQSGEFLDPSKKIEAEKKVILAGLEAITSI